MAENKTPIHNQMGYITKEGLNELLNYKYKPGGYTWLDSKMNYFWEWCVSLIPLWVAPNLITFIGWIMVILSYANMLRYDYTFKQDIPSSCFFFAAFCLFVYMTLDAIDGKQARRTKTSSPLGQLFDHGCDSFSIVFFMLAVSQGVKLQKDEVFLIFIASQASFWISNWSEYNTGVLRTKVGQFGVTEAEFTIIFIHLFTGIFGQQMWQTSLALILHLPKSFLAGLHPTLFWAVSQNLGDVVIYFYSMVMIAMCMYVLIKTTLYSKDKVRTICESSGFLMLAMMELAWSNMDIYQKYNGIILVNFGIVASTIVCKMIICSVTKMRFQYFHRELLPLGIATMILAYLDITHHSQKMMISTFWACFVINLIMIIHFLVTTVNQITEFLGIYCFSTQKRQKNQ